jgi:hypothetical protein
VCVSVHLCAFVVHVSQTWMDEYSELYYIEAPKSLQFRTMNMSDRIDMRNKLKCSSFSSMIDRVFPGLFLCLCVHVDVCVCSRCVSVCSFVCVCVTTRRSLEA